MIHGIQIDMGNTPDKMGKLGAKLGMDYKKIKCSCVW